MTPDYIISQISEEERNRLASKFPGLRDRWALSKLFVDGRWHYGFTSREQAERAMGGSSNENTSRQP